MELCTSVHLCLCYYTQLVEKLSTVMVNTELPDTSYYEGVFQVS